MAAGDSGPGTAHRFSPSPHPSSSHAAPAEQPAPHLQLVPALLHKLTQQRQGAGVPTHMQHACLQRSTQWVAVLFESREGG